MPRLTRSSIIHGVLVAFAAALVVRAAHVQLVQGRDWAERARRQQFAGADLPAPRGTIYDEAKRPLAESRELVRIAVAPRELRERDRAVVRRELLRLGVARPVATRAVEPGQRWVAIPRSFLPGEVASLLAVRGVHATPAIVRDYTERLSTRRIVGAVDAAGNAVSGIEAALDEHLRGRAGRTVVARDAGGRKAATPAAEGTPPEPGRDIVLTINQELQEIAERALQNAAGEMGAEGGDIVILDPMTGEIRAIATLRRGRGTGGGSPALSEPFEPGSTLKPFVAARLIALGRTRPDELLNTENGVWTHEGRTFRDVHRAARMDVAEVIAQSSNIGIVKLASRLSRAEQYELLRDLGFGTPTLVPFPSEASGTLRAPRDWSRTSAASLAMGYEIAVTPLQLAMAYASFANGGLLLEPALVKEIRSPDGERLYEHEPRVVRRVMPAHIALRMRDLLRGTVAGGSASAADLGTFAVAGKTGTARRNVGGRYVSGQYTASFVGLFPVDRPQVVILVKLDNPTSAIYGGRTAAPISKVVLEAALAAHDATLDRGALVRSAAPRAAAPTPVPPQLAEGTRADSAIPRGAAPPPSPSPGGTETFVLNLPLRRDSTTTGAGRRETREVPEVRGLPVRDAARVLHLAGFRVRLTGSGTAASTAPAAGTRLASGSVVRLVARP